MRQPGAVMLGVRQHAGPRNITASLFSSCMSFSLISAAVGIVRVAKNPRALSRRRRAYVLHHLAGVELDRETAFDPFLHTAPRTLRQEQPG